MSVDFDKQYRIYREMIEAQLARMLSPEQMNAPELLVRSVNYSVEAGGKRIRPVLCLACARMLGTPEEDVLPVACAIEMVHTYSLIHDDLPGMDNDDLRRGKPTSHKVFGEGHAILAGDALLNYAFECLLDLALSKGERMGQYLQASREIAHAAGVRGMIAGQSMDLQSEHQQSDEQTLRYIYEHKTADLLTAPLTAAAYISGCTQEEVEAFRRIGQDLGVAFQIDDDLLDIESTAEVLGKMPGSDEKNGKMTWPALVGVPQAHAVSREMWDHVQTLLTSYGWKAEFLLRPGTRLRNRNF